MKKFHRNLGTNAQTASRRELDELTLIEIFVELLSAIDGRKKADSLLFPFIMPFQVKGSCSVGLIMRFRVFMRLMGSYGVHLESVAHQTERKINTAKLA
jgi:hypothetical protein